jgi:hypothetical protein
VVKTGALGVRIEAAIKHALEKAAAEERRSVSSMVEIALSDWLTEHGYLKNSGHVGEPKSGKRRK